MSVIRRARSVVAAASAACALALTVGALAPGPGPAAAATVAPATAAAPGDRPNILLITSDDQRDDEMRWMPFTRRLIGRAGIDVTDFVSPHPLCCPARAEILTGEYAQNNGVRYNRGPYGGWQAFVDGGNTDEQLGAWLHDAGYQTGLVGKMLNGYGSSSTPPPGFDHWNPTVRRTYGYYGTTFYDDGYPVAYPDEHVADVVSDYTHDYLREFSSRPAPWFLWVSHVGPHNAVGRSGDVKAPIPAARHAGLFRHAVPPSLRSASFNEADVRDKPRVIRGHRVDADAITHLFRERIRTLQSIDEANRAAIRQLRRLGELDDTIVVYASDNGFLLGEHRLTGKNYPYEKSLQVPFLIRGPGLPAGVDLDERLAMVDVAPTFLAAAGVLDDVRAAGHTDGLDMTPVLQGAEPAPGTQLIQAGTDQPRALEEFGWWWRGVSSGRWTYARWYDGEEELYDRRRDQAQLDNLADRRRYRPVLRELRTRYDALAACAGAADCRGDLGPAPRPPSR